MLPTILPMPLGRRALPFDHPDWIFELKYDGFRSLAIVENGRAQLISRNGHPFASFEELGKQIAGALQNGNKVVPDGEIVCVDESGKPQFRDLLFHRGTPCFFAFDLLFGDGEDWRSERLLDRNQELRRLLKSLPVISTLKYADHVEGRGIELYRRVIVFWQRRRLAIETHQPNHTGESQYAQPLLQVKMYENVTRKQRQFNLLATVFPSSQTSIERQEGIDRSFVQLPGYILLMTRIGIRCVPLRDRLFRSWSIR